MTTWCGDVLMLCGPFITRTVCACGVRVCIRRWHVAHMIQSRRSVVVSIMITMGINDFDDCHHWWRHVVVTCWCCADLSSRGLCEIMGYVSGSGDEMLRTQCNNGGCCVINYDNYGYQWVWWLSSLMTTCCGVVLMMCGPFITRTVWDHGVRVWIRWWNVANAMQSRGVLCYPLWWLWVSMILMNVIIDDDMLWCRVDDVRTFHHTDCVRPWGTCLDPMFEFHKHNTINGGGKCHPLFWWLGFIYRW